MDTITRVTLIVLGAALILPLLATSLSRCSARLDRAVRVTVFGIYLLANLYETILFRVAAPEPNMELEPLWSYREAFQIADHLEITSYALFEEIILNILLYIPFGYLLPFTFPKLKPLPVLWICAGCSLFTEMTQLVFHIGLCELDDLINNSLGAGIGVCMYWLWMRKRDPMKNALWARKG